MDIARRASPRPWKYVGPAAVGKVDRYLIFAARALLSTVLMFDWR